MGLHSEPRLGDAFGREMLAELADGSGTEPHFVERSDGYLNVIPHEAYFTDIADWAEVDRACFDRLNG